MAKAKTDPVSTGPAAGRLLSEIQHALGTEETGDALVEVASNAHRAEQELAGIVKMEESCPDPDMSLHRIAVALERLTTSGFTLETIRLKR